MAMYFRCSQCNKKFKAEELETVLFDTNLNNPICEECEEDLSRIDIIAYED